MDERRAWAEQRIAIARQELRVGLALLDGEPFPHNEHVFRTTRIGDGGTNYEVHGETWGPALQHLRAAAAALDAEGPPTG